MLKTKKLITLSPNEEESYLRNEEKRKRLIRLQQVRMQEKKLSENRVKSYNSIVEKEVEDFLLKLEEEWKKNKSKRVDNLTELKRISKNYIGAAQYNAKIQRTDDEKKREQLIMKLINEKLKENERFINAQKKFCEDSLARTSTLTSSIHNQSKAVDIANSRSKHMLDIYRHRKRYVFPMDDDFLNKYGKNLSNKDGAGNFNSTYYHKNYNAIRCDCEGKIIDSTDKAAYENMNNERLNKNNQQKLRETIRVTKKRYEKALGKITDEKTREIFKRNLETLEKLDRERKTDNVIHYSNKAFNIKNGGGNMDKILDTINSFEPRQNTTFYSHKEVDKIPKKFINLSTKTEWKINSTAANGQNSSNKLHKKSNNSKMEIKIGDKNHLSNKVVNNAKGKEDFTGCDLLSIANKDIIRNALIEHRKEKEKHSK